MVTCHFLILRFFLFSAQDGGWQPYRLINLILGMIIVGMEP